MALEREQQSYRKENSQTTKHSKSSLCFTTRGPIPYFLISIHDRRGIKADFKQKSQSNRCVILNASRIVSNKVEIKSDIPVLRSLAMDIHNDNRTDSFSLLLSSRRRDLRSLKIP